jgi:hypothetical protein
MPAGGGKIIMLPVPALIQNGTAIVVSPLCIMKISRCHSKFIFESDIARLLFVVDKTEINQ